MIVIGVDPGSVKTGIVVINGPELVDFFTVRRDRKGGQPFHPYREAVEACVQSMALAKDATVCAIEDVVSPNPHVGMTNPIYAIETAVVFGSVLTRMKTIGIRTVIVPPGGHGSNPLAAYPEQIRGVKGERGNGVLTHKDERSAYDVAITAPTHIALQKAEQL